jgi:subtilisin family serine protease
MVKEREESARDRARLGLALLALALLVPGAVEVRAQAAGGPDDLAQPVRGAGDDVDADGEHVPGELLLRFRDGTPAAARRRAQRALGARSLRSFTAIGVHHWRLPPGLDVQKAIDRLSNGAAGRALVYAEPNYLFRSHDAAQDPRRGDLWGLHNLGQTGGTADADIDALEAWSVHVGSAEVVVGIIDSGLDYTHEDLAAHVWVNPGEDLDADGIVSESDFNGVDDDGNGYVDDLRGWDFRNDDNDPMDDNGHGTHTAGTVGAVGDNGIGVTGVCRRVTLMPLKFLDAGGSGSTDDAIDAVLYAASFETEAGGKIVRFTNNSWGGGRRSRALEDAIAASGSLFIASAGNDGHGRKQYPSGYDLDNVVSVAATDHADELASFSNYGSDWVDLAAPGVRILSTVPSNGYGNKNGTSMAAPHVTGAAALLLASNPGWTNAQVKSALLEGVDELPALGGLVLTNGRLNLRASIGADELPPDESPPGTVADFSASASGSASVDASWTAEGDAGEAAYLNDVRYTTGVLDESTWDSATQAQGEPLPATPGTLESFAITGLSPGTAYQLGLRTMDASGNVSVLSDVKTATTESNGWIVTAVDENDGGFYSSHVLDPATGEPLVAYDSGGAVNLARRADGSWESEVVDDGNDVDTGLSIGVDPVDGSPSISYGWGKLRVAHWTGSSWDVQVLESKQAYNDVTSLVFDEPTQAGYISYRVTESGRRNPAALKLARRTGGSWQTEVVDLGAGARYNCVALAPDGSPAIAYSDDLDDDNTLDALKFAQWNADTEAWDIEVVESGMRGGGVRAGLAFDPDGRPAVIHRVSSSSSLRYLTKDESGAWQLELLPLCNNPGLAFAPDGTALVGCIKYDTNNEIRLMRRVAPGTWEYEQVIRGVNSGIRVDTVPDDAGQPTLSWGCCTLGTSFAERDVP